MMDKKLILKILANAISYDSKKILECSEHTKLVDIGLESINFIQFIVKLEEEFDIEVSDSDLLLSNFETIEKLFSTLEKYFYKDFQRIVLYFWFRMSVLGDQRTRQYREQKEGKRRGYILKLWRNTIIH